MTVTPARAFLGNQRFPIPQQDLTLTKESPMGCWNETCVLTRTPITAGAPVVVLQVITGLHYMASESYKTSLLLGLPMQGRYDDYGGVEDLEQPNLEDLAQQAFLGSGLYRTVPLERHRLQRTHSLGTGPLDETPLLRRGRAAAW